MSSKPCNTVSVLLRFALRVPGFWETYTILPEKGFECNVAFSTASPRFGQLHGSPWMPLGRTRGAIPGSK